MDPLYAIILFDLNSIGHSNQQGIGAATEIGLMSGLLSTGSSRVEVPS